MSSFMDLNLKNASPAFMPEHIQAMIVARNGAHFFDVSQEVTEKVEQIMEAMPKHGTPRFPTPKGYVRFNWPAESLTMRRPGDDALMLRINGALWHGTKVYMTVDASEAVDSCRIVPFVVDAKGHDQNDPVIKDRMAKGYVLVGSENAEEILHAETIAYDVGAQVFEKFHQPIGDFLTMMAIAFDMFGEIAATEQSRERVERAFKSKHNAFYEKTTLVKIKLNRCRTKYLKRTGEATGRKMGFHEPRGHWCHYRITKPDCPHTWIERMPDAPNKQKCAHCGEWRTWREFPNGKGDKSRGIIHTHYEVVS